MNHVNRTLIIVVMFFMAVTLQAQTMPRLGILPFTGGVGNDGETIAMLFSYQPEILSAFTVVPRTSNVNSIMAEQQFQRSGLTDSDTISSLGRQLNADFVVAGHIQKLGDRNLVLITIINVESLQQIAGDYREYGNIEEIQGLIPDMAQRLIAATRLDTSNLPKLAVLPFNIPQGVNVQDAEVLAQLLATEVANSGKYAVLPRTKTIETAMSEQKIQRSGLTDPNSIKAIGQATNAQYVLAGDVRSLGSQNMFMASILNIEDASQMAGDSKNYRTIADGLQLMAELSGTLTGNAGTGVPQRTAANETSGGSVFDQMAAEAERTAAAAKPVKPDPISGFSSGRRLGAGVLNLALGIGSFTMGDVSGGLTLLAGYAAAGGLMFYETTLKYEDALAGVVGPIGLGVAGATVLYGFIRPFVYQKSTSTTALIDILDRVNIAIIPDTTGIKAMGLSYTYQF
jgi:TolB-like protein